MEEEIVVVSCLHERLSSVSAVLFNLRSEDNILVTHALARIISQEYFELSKEARNGKDIIAFIKKFSNRLLYSINEVFILDIKKIQNTAKDYILYTLSLMNYDLTSPSDKYVDPSSFLNIEEIEKIRSNSTAFEKIYKVLLSLLDKAES